MATISAYWRPTSAAEAFELLARPHAVVLAGGTALTPAATDEPVEVVDLQALHLDRVEARFGGWLVLGAMATLQQVADSEGVPPAVSDAARRELPSTLRTQATVGGCIACGHRDSELLAALLVHDAVVRVDDRDGSEELPLDALLAGLPLPRGHVIMGVTLRTTGASAVARAARTGADTPIVAAYVRENAGVQRVALTGVAATPILVESGAADLDPPGDFRGSPAYRKAIAAVLIARAVEELT